MKLRLAIAHVEPDDARVDVEVNEDGFVHLPGGVWKTVDELAVELEADAHRRHGLTARRDHRDIGRDLARFFWDLYKRSPAER